MRSLKEKTMANTITLRFDLSSEKLQELEALASQEGYETVADYARALIERIAELKLSIKDLEDQSFFWTPEWQAREREANNDLAAGRVKTFGTIDELIADLFDE